MKTEGNLNFGQKFCNGNGIIIHDFKFNSNSIVFEFEYPKTMPFMEISKDGNKWTGIDKNPFKIYFRKTAIEKIYLRINDTENSLSAYSLYFDGDSIPDLSQFIGLNLLKK